MDVTTLIDTYCMVWSASEATERSELLRRVWAEGASYTDPTVHAQGHDELLAHIAGVLAKRPGSKVVRTSLVDMHHNIARFAWCAVEADGTRRPEGLDIAFLSPDGLLIERVVGFFGPLGR